MRISLPHQFVYISTPKACTHTVYKILGEHFAEGLLEDGFHNNQVRPEFQSIPRWTVVRNPYSRAVSLWWSTCRCHPQDQYGARQGCGAADDFPRFVEWLSSLDREFRRREPLFQSQAEWLDPVQPIQALQLERLEEELPKMPWWKEGIVLPCLNTTAEKVEAQSQTEGFLILRPTWQELCWKKEVREGILTWAERDFDLFGYSTQVE